MWPTYFLKTKLINKTDHQIDFEIIGRRDCPLRSMPAGESQRVRLNHILKLDDTTPIRVQTNGRIYDKLLNSDHILTIMRIVFKSEERADSSYELIAEGVAETYKGRYLNFGGLIDWDKKIYDKLPPRPSSMVEPSVIYENNLPLRSSQRSNIVEPSVNENALPLRNSPHPSIMEPSVINDNNPFLRLVNKTDQLIDFDVEHGYCPLVAMPAGESQRVAVHVVLNINFNRPTSPIRVLINGRFHGMWLHPYRIAKMTQIVFKYQHGLLIAEGSIESYFDRFFGCCIKLIYSI
ncbi:hypothetical protein SASPL_153138 [Salvia splendens]|uniref:Uncharacterized protein n=1 Tax=Salvia splendens TaxID=180675 RepID=A0A8X8Z0Q1_SALSN|nr:hypothetical protein SASPL_153138 [Salvia splendens]